MRTALRSKLTYSNVVSTLCLFIVLGGVAYAADQLAPNSVGTKQLKNGAVTLKKINKQAQAELKRGLPGTPDAIGVVGPQGAKGDSGASGQQGPAGPAGATVDAFFGSGADGDETVSGHVSLDRDTYFDDLTLEPDAELRTNGFRLFVAGTLTMENGSSINRNGPSTSSECEASALSPRTLGGSGVGGCNSVSGGYGGDVANSLGGDGGGTGDARGAADTPATNFGGAQVFASATQALTGRDLNGNLINGGAGGEGSNPTLGGGAGGGVVVVGARSIVVSGSASISADGGAGLYGGGGGVVVVVSSVPQPAGLALSVAPGVSDATSAPAEQAEPGYAAWLD
ncbi:MAG TPA: collagen-like protein [Solirubrobacterales bacterium]